LFDIMLLKGTSAGSAARISRVGASNFGVTRTNLQLPSKGSLTRSNGSTDLHDVRSYSRLTHCFYSLLLMSEPEYVV
jgi:hypothetical protein